jgi:adenosylhomocysteinase
MITKQHDIRDIRLAPEGKKRIVWAGSRMKVLEALNLRFTKEKPLKNIRLGACLHVTAETANLMLTLKNGGADVILCASNPLSTQDIVAASLVKDFGIPVFAIHGENNKTYYEHLQSVLNFMPNITMDDGADLINQLHKLRVTSYELQIKKNPPTSRLRRAKQKKEYFIKNPKGHSWEFLGSSEETTTGVIRLKAMEKNNALKVPVIAVNDSDTKHLFDNRYGTGQSTIDGILRATNILLAGKTFVVCGYGQCGRGLAARAKGMGAHVIVTEIDPIRALEAVMDGFMVMPIAKAAKNGDIFVTVTGDKSVITLSHIKSMKDGAIVANSGHFNVEVEIEKLTKIAKNIKEVRPNVVGYSLSANKTVYVLGEGRLINLVAAEGHPSEVMDMSFADQALAAEWFVKMKGKLENKVYTLPKKLDEDVARLKLKAMGVSCDTLTSEQKKYLSEYSEGT